MNEDRRKLRFGLWYEAARLAGGAFEPVEHLAGRVDLVVVPDGRVGGEYDGGAAQSVRRQDRENKAENDGPLFTVTRLDQCGELDADAVSERVRHFASTAGCGPAGRPSPDLVLPPVGPV